jgi:hypothetical protein
VRSNGDELRALTLEGAQIVGRERRRAPGDVRGTGNHGGGQQERQPASPQTKGSERSQEETRDQPKERQMQAVANKKAGNKRHGHKCQWPKQHAGR